MSRRKEEADVTFEEKRRDLTFMDARHREQLNDEFERNEKQKEAAHKRQMDIYRLQHGINESS